MRISQKKLYHLAFGISTNNAWFKDKENVTVSFDDYGLSFEIAGIDEYDDAVKIYKSGFSGYQMSLYGHELKEGLLVFNEEESTIDRIYFDYI